MGSEDRREEKAWSEVQVFAPILPHFFSSIFSNTDGKIKGYFFFPGPAGAIRTAFGPAPKNS
jgi:hypothetical protein